MPKKFDQVAKEQFDFLTTNFGFNLSRLTETDDGFDILYTSDVCGVHVVYEFSEAYVFVSLHKLVGGEFVDNPRDISVESVLTQGDRTKTPARSVRSPEGLRTC